MKTTFSAILVFGFLVPEIISAQPANDNCTGAVVLYQLAECSPFAGTTIDATESVPAETCSGLTGYADDDVWYVFSAITSSPTIYVAGDASFDAVVDLRSDVCNGTSIACVDQKGPGGTEKLYCGNLVLGVSYYIRIYSYGSGAGAQGTFSVCVFGAPPYPPVNNECYNATGIDSPYTNGSTLSATKSAEPITCEGITGSSDDDVWYKFDASWENPTITVVGSPYFDAVVDLRSTPCDGTTLFCADATPMGGTETLKASGLSIGSTYLVRVYSYGDGPNFEGNFTIAVSETVCLACPDYDYYISPGPEWQVHHSLISSDGCNNYQVSVNEGNEYTFKTGCGDGASADFDTYLDLYDADCNSISSNDNSCEENLSKLVWVATYYGFAHLNIHGSDPGAYGSYYLAYEISDAASVPRPSDETSLPYRFSIYPNPASSAFQVESRQVSFTELVLFDITGRPMRKFETGPRTKFQLTDLQQLAPGLYILALRTSDGWVHERIEITR
jgi:hypothetical protein